MEKAVVLLNPSSGRGRSIRKKKKIEQIFKKYKIEYDLFVSKSEEDLKKLSFKVLREYKKIIGVGGDTTFNIIASEILKHRKTNQNYPILGMIGTGSANDICRSLGMKKVGVLCDAIVNSRIKKMDVGMVKLKGPEKKLFFLGSMSAGLGTAVNRYLEKFTRKHKYFSGIKFISQELAGGMGIFKSFSNNLVPISVTLFSNGVMKDFQFSLLVFLNTNYYANGLKLNPDSNAFDGQIDCVIINTSSPLHTLKFKYSVKKGNHLQKKEFQKIRSNRFLVKSESKIDIQLDGEIIDNVEECEVSVLPQVLDVFVPF